MKTRSTLTGLALAMTLGGIASVGVALPPPLPPSSGQAQAVRDRAPTRVEFKQTVHDLGQVFEHETREFDFEFTNAGEETLEIYEVRSTCGCTAAEPDKKIYEPGESGKIHIKYDPKGKHGPQNRSVFIECNDLSGQRVELKVQANVLQLVRVEPSIISLGTVRKGESATTTFTVTGRTPDFEATRATSRQAGLFSATPVKTEDVVEDGQTLRMTTFELKFNGQLQPGRLDDELTVRTNDPRREVLSVPVMTSIQGDIAVAPLRIAIGRPYLGDTFEREFTVAHRDGKPFKLLGVEFDDGPVQVEFETRPVNAETMDAYKVRMSVTAARVHPRINQDLIIRTDVEGEEEIRIPVSGVVRLRP